MDKIIAVFNNRNQSMQLASVLKKMGIPCKTVNTPRELSNSCGISVVFPKEYLTNVKTILQRYSYLSMVKMYLITKNSYKKYIAI